MLTGRGCPGGFPAHTKITNGVIYMCFDSRMAESNMQQTIIHEVQHANDSCMHPNINPRDWTQCVTYEYRACEASCGYLFPKKDGDYNRCVECCTYFSCRHHIEVQQPNPPCDASAIPTRPCWKYDPDKPGFVKDPDDPRCHPRKRKGGVSFS